MLFDLNRAYREFDRSVRFAISKEKENELDKLEDEIDKYQEEFERKMRNSWLFFNNERNCKLAKKTLGELQRIESRVKKVVSEMKASGDGYRGRRAEAIMRWYNSLKQDLKDGSEGNDTPSTLRRR